MSRACFSPRAQRDLEDIWRFIANDNPAAAETVRGAILDLADRLQTNPEVGCMIRGTAKRHDNIRWVVIPRFRNYLLFYRPFRAGIVVVRVLHAARDWTRFFPRRDSRSQ